MLLGVTSLTVVNHRHLLNDFRNLTPRPFEGDPNYPDQLVNPIRLEEVLFCQFPHLKQLTLIGAVFDHRNVQKQLTERLVVRHGGSKLTHLQMHFAEHPNRIRLSWKRPTE